LRLFAPAVANTLYCEFLYGNLLSPNLVNLSLSEINPGALESL